MSHIFSKGIGPISTDGVTTHADLFGLDQNDHPQYSLTAHTHDDRYYSEVELDALLNTKSNTGHTHNDLYYSESEVDTLLDGKSNTGHTHDDRYYTETETDLLLDDKSDTGHTHFASKVGGGASVADCTFATNSQGYHFFPGSLTVQGNEFYIDENGASNVSSLLFHAADAFMTYNHTGSTYSIGPAWTTTEIQGDIQVNGSSSGIDHGDLDGRADDDHTQYHNDTRGEEWLTGTTHGDIEFASLTATVLEFSPDGEISYDSGTTLFTMNQDLAVEGNIHGIVKDTIGFSFAGGGDVIAAGSTRDYPITHAMTIIGYTLISPVSGSIAIDLDLFTYANYPTGVSTEVEGTGTKPTISSAYKNQDTTLTNWNITLAANTILRATVDTVTDIEDCTLIIEIERSI